MIITQLKAFRFGRHDQFEFECNAPVVGLLGPNGSGKSTLLTLLEFLITGEAPDALETYVKDLDGNGGGEMTFTKNGQVGSIMRQVGKSPKRLLRWGGQELARAKEVDAIMAKIFGADKKAVANAVFVNQGDLQRILFNDDADRRQMFVRIMNLAFCEQRARIIDGKIKKLESTIEDLSESLHLAKNLEEAATRGMAELKEKLISSPSWEKEIQFLANVLQLEADVNHARENLQAQQQEKKVHEDKLASHLKTCNKDSIEGIKKERDEANTKLEHWQEEYRRVQGIWAELVNYDRATKEITDSTAELGRIAQRFQLVNPHCWSMEAWEKYEGELSREIDDGKEVQSLLQQMTAVEADLLSDSIALANLIPPDMTWDNVESLRESVSILGGTLDVLRKSLAFQTELASCFIDSEQSQECPKCGLKVQPGQMISAEHLTKCQAQIDKMETVRNEQRTTVARYEKEWGDYHRSKAAIDARIKREAEQLASLGEKLKGRRTKDLVRLEQNRTDVRSSIESLKNLIYAQKTHAETLQFRKNERATYTQAIAVLPNRAVYTTEVLGTIDKEIKKYKELGIIWNRYCGQAEQLRGILENLEKNINSTNQTIVRNTAALGLMNFPDSLKEVRENEMPGYAPGAIKFELEARQRIHDGLAGQLREAEQSWQRSHDSHEEILRRIRVDAIKRSLIDDLRKLQRIVSNDGLPLSWIRYQFEHLAKLTQEVLTELNANFSIAVDRGTEMGFTFTRLDGATAVALPMTKLSGGQKVRLCVAFLMAIQKRLVPEVGLLVIDELSDLDDEGIDSMVELMRGLAVKLQNTDHQLWMVNHEPKFEAALQKFKKLAN